MNKINSEYQRHLDVLSGLPGLGAYEQQAEIGDRMARGEQAEDEARPHDDEPSVVYVVEGEETGVLHVAASEELAKAWIAKAGHGAYLVISELAVARG